jgi:predicted nicotinamide N-methyase
MHRFRGHDVRIEQPIIGHQSWNILAPTAGDRLLNDPSVIERFERDEYLPYWATLWPAALLLAEEVAAWPTAATPLDILEIGCGLGLVGIIAAARGHRVTLSDYDDDALAFATENARLNNVTPATIRRLDWRNPQFDNRAHRILAADVLYEARSLTPVAQFVWHQLHPDGYALISDPNRRTADGFEQVARRCGLNVSCRNVEREHETRPVPIQGRIYQLSRDRPALP